MRSVHYSIGSRQYELSNHLGNVLSVVSDKVIPNFDHGVIAEMRADIRVAQDYSPFGVTLSRRNFSVSEGYSYGFNGMEKDNEVKGQGNSYDFGARMYDARLGRWLTIDPLAKKYPSSSPYSFVSNSPNLLIDPNGMERVNSHAAKAKELESMILNNPNDKKLKKQLKRELEQSIRVEKLFETFRENDLALYNYIDNLTVTDAISGEIINVKVNVSLEGTFDSPNGESASTSYFNKKTDGSKYYTKYKSKESEDEEEIFPGPVNSKDQIGFDVIIYGSGEVSDESLANEAGDVMFRLGYPIKAKKSGSDKTKSYDDYIKPGTAGDYSFRVEDIYKKRKKEGTGKDPSNNPYPIKNRSNAENED